MGRDFPHVFSETSAGWVKRPSRDIYDLTIHLNLVVD